MLELPRLLKGTKQGGWKAAQEGRANTWLGELSTMWERYHWSLWHHRGLSSRSSWSKWGIDFGTRGQILPKCGSFCAVYHFGLLTFLWQLSRLFTNTIGLTSAIVPAACVSTLPAPPPVPHTWRPSHSRMLFGVAVTAGRTGCNCYCPRTDQRWPPHLGGWGQCRCARR